MRPSVKSSVPIHHRVPPSRLEVEKVLRIVRLLVRGPAMKRPAQRHRHPLTALMNGKAAQEGASIGCGARIASLRSIIGGHAHSAGHCCRHKRFVSSLGCNANRVDGGSITFGVLDDRFDRLFDYNLRIPCGRTTGARALCYDSVHLRHFEPRSGPFDTAKMDTLLHQMEQSTTRVLLCNVKRKPPHRSLT